jgi:hypothetical protein
MCEKNTYENGKEKGGKMRMKKGKRKKAQREGED